MIGLQRSIGFVVICAFTACVSVLGLPDQKAQRPFAHRAHVLEGIACVTCHEKVVQSEAATALDLPTSDTCVQCHSTPHETAPCGRCHGQERMRERAQAAKAHLRFSHQAHVDVATGVCTRCHGGIAAGDGPLRPTMASCFTCHEHSTEWTTRDCNACHRDMVGEQSRPLSHLVHGPDFMDSHGNAAAGAQDLCESCHQQSDCAACHGVRVAVLPNVLRFEQVNRAQLHRAGFAARHALEARSEPALCMTCHAEDSCRQCHRERRVLERSELEVGRRAHPPGWVGPRGAGNRHGLEARRDPMACASCHGGAGEALCVGCHQVGGPGGNPHPAGFSSRKPRSESPCRLCHSAAGAWP